MLTRFIKRVLRGWVVLVIVSPFAFYAVQAGLVEEIAQETVTQAKVELVSSDPQGVVLSFSAPPAADLLNWLEQVATGQGVETESIGMTSEAGTAQLPVYRTLVGIPADAAYELVVWSESQTVVKNVGSLAPVPRAIPQAEGQSGVGMMEAVRDEHFYASRVVYPEAAVKIVEEAWFRDQRVLKVEFYPLQYLPAEGEAYWHPYLRAEIRLKTSGAEMEKRSESSTVVQGDDVFDGILDGLIINYESAREWQGLPDVLPQIQDFPITDGQPALKLVVTHPGIYQVSYEDMAATGMDVEGVNPANFHLMNLDQVAAYDFVGNTNTIFEPNEKVIFYGEGLPSLRLEAMYQTIMTPLIAQCPSVCRVKDLIENYTDENVYWLYVGSEPGLRMNTVEGEPIGNFQISTFFTDTQYAEGDFLWHPTNLTSADVWFWKRARPDLPYSMVYTLPITLGVVSPLNAQAVVRGELMSRANTAHITRIYINNTLILTSNWSGLVRYRFEQSFDSSLLLDGENELRFEVVANGAFQDIYFDWFEIIYGREYTAEADRLAFAQTQAGSWRYIVDGLESGEGVVLDVSDPLQPVKVEHVNYLYLPEIQAEFELTNQAAMSIFVAGAGGGESPKAISWYEPPELEPLAGADYIFITHRDFLTATQRLADYRSSQGLRTVVVDIEDVYNQFNYGIFHTVAIRNYLEKAMLTWPGPAPRYVLLVGDASFELRPVANSYKDEINFLPPYLGIIDPWQGEMDGTSLLAAVVGTDIMPDLAIGRIPAKTAVEVNAVVDKTIAYEQTPLADWQRRILYIADNNDAAGLFRETSDRLASAYTPSGYSAYKYYYCLTVDPLPEGCVTSATTLNQMIMNDLNTNGALFVNYTGHGATPYWAGERLLHRDNVADLNNGARLPVVLSWTCLDGFFLYPAFEPGITTVPQTPTIIESLLMTAGKGAVATFSPTGMGVGTGHEFLAQGFYNTIFRNGIWDLGAASLGAKLKLYNSGAYDDLMKTYFIFGDPALQFPNPYSLSVSPENEAAEGGVGFETSYLITVKNTGPVADSYVITVESSQWPITTPGTVGPVVPGAQIDFQVRVEVPEGTEDGVIDTAVIRVASYGDRSKYELVTLTTTANVLDKRINLPLVTR